MHSSPLWMEALLCGNRFLFFSSVIFILSAHFIKDLFKICNVINMYRLRSHKHYGCSWWNLMIYNVCGGSLEEEKPLQWWKRSSAGVGCLGTLWEVKVCWVFKSRLDKQLSVLVWLMLPCGKGMKQITCWVPYRLLPLYDDAFALNSLSLCKSVFILGLKRFSEIIISFSSWCFIRFDVCCTDFTDGEAAPAITVL